MNQYFKLESSNYVNFGICKSPKLAEQSVMKGQFIDPDKLPELIFEHDFPVGEPMPHYLTGGTVLASQKLLKVLDNVGVDNYQAFPAILVNPQTKEIKRDYYLFNVLGLVKATSINDSNYDELMKGSPEGIDLPLLAFNELVIDSKKTYGTYMFRLAEEPISIIVNAQVVHALKKNKPDEGWGVVVEELEVN